MKLLALLAVLAFASCAPVVDPPAPEPPPVVVEPTEPVEPPVVEEPEEPALVGQWFGRIVNSQGTFVTVLAELTVEDDVVTGTMTFLDEPTLTVGEVTGTVDGGLTVTVTDGIETLVFHLTGDVENDVFAGTVDDLLGSPAFFSFGKLP